jgi:transposase InsO family protein
VSEEAGVGLKVVSMAELRLDVLTEPRRTGETVADVCRRYGISRDTYYRYRRRYLAEGLEGLEDQSRRPKTSPVKISPETEIRICEMRRDHPRWGARRIRAELAREGVDPPAVSTVHQALRRNGLVAPQPPRQPRADKRFEREIANDLWQIDATQIPLDNGTKAWVVDLIDDHSRYLLAAVVGTAPTGELAWDAFEIAATRYGLPRQVLSDNGMCFTGRLQGVEVAFERSLKELDVEMINSGPYHPQTLGKLERFHRTLKEWLRDEGPAFDPEHLQELLDGFRHHYNRQRPHQGIGDQTPAERYGTDPLPPAQIRLPGPEEMTGPSYPPHSILRKVGSSGNLGYRGKLIQVGSRWAGATLRILPIGALIHIYHGELVIRTLALDPDSYYQPLNGHRAKGRSKLTKTSLKSVR